MNQAEIRDRLLEYLGEESATAAQFRDQITVTTTPERIREALAFLKSDKDLAFDYLSFVGGVDKYPLSPRFEVVYQLYSFAHNHRFRVKTTLEDIKGGKPSVDSAVDLWPTAEWHERETAEMYGIEFKNHPDPRNLLLPNYWKVNPLRKDFPVQGNEQTPDLPPGEEGNI
jgi:NADH-quinone oxidoreductase subunit C